jgi:hypothetical protein
VCILTEPKDLKVVKRLRFTMLRIPLGFYSCLNTGLYFQVLLSLPYWHQENNQREESTLMGYEKDQGFLQRVAHRIRKTSQANKVKLIEKAKFQKAMLAYKQRSSRMIKAVANARELVEV